MCDAELAGVVAVGDAPRAEAHEAVAALKKAGLQVWA
jgi:cation transport ATPase